MAQLTLPEFIAEWHSDQTYVSAHTSGSTGAPKPLRLPKDLMRRSAERTNRFFGIGPWSRLHLCLSPGYIAGKMMIVRAIVARCHLTSEPPSNNPLDPQFTGGPTDRASLRRRISLLAVVPSQLYSLLDHPERLRLVDNILVGGSPIPPELRRRLAAIPITCWESYGMTETASHVALRPVTADPSLPFTLLSGITCSLSDRGTLQLKAISRLSALCPQLTTNDCAEVLSPTTFRLLGRLDHAIISGGIKIHPQQLEAEVADLLAPFQPCYITSRPDPKWGERVVLVLSAISDASQLSAPGSQLLNALRERLGPIRAPREIVVFPTFSYTSTGKLIRQKLK